MNNDDNEIEELRGVRVRYSTIVNYVSHIYRLGVAVLFAIITTRKLSVEEYGLFTTLIALATLFTSIYDIWNFWIIRYNARKRYELVSSCFFINTVYAPIAFTLILVLSIYYVSMLKTQHIYFIISGILVLINLLFTYFRSISLSTKPFIEGKVSIIEHSVRIIMAYILVVVFSLKLLGALLTVILTITSSLPIYYLFLKKYRVELPKPGFNSKNVLLLIKNSYISLVSTLHDFLRQLDRPLLTALTNSTLASAYIGVSYVPRSVILQSSSAFTASLSARLLRKPIREDIDYILRISLIINTGLLLLLIMLSKPLLSLFREEYIEANVLFIIFSLESFIYVFLTIFVSIASSIEREDLDKFGLELVDTALFKLRFYMFTTGLTVVLISSITVFMLQNIGFKDPVILGLPFSISWLVSTFFLTIYGYKTALKKIEFNIPWIEVLYVVVSCIITFTITSFFNLTNIVIRNVWIDVPKVFFSAIIVLATYFSFEFILSKWFRNFVKTIVNYLMSRVL